MQRFGRANRHLRRGRDFRATLLTYEPDSPRPYDKAELAAALAFLTDLSGDAVSQRDLAVGLERHALKERDVSGSSAFLDGGYFATPGALRDGDDSGAAVVLDSDVARFNDCAKAHEPTEGLIVTVPKKMRAPPMAPACHGGWVSPTLPATTHGSAFSLTTNP